MSGDSLQAVPQSTAKGSIPRVHAPAFGARAREDDAAVLSGGHGKLGNFRDILLHDGSSFALKDGLATQWPGRFTEVSPAAVELHVTMSAFEDNPVRVTLAPDNEAERAFGPKAADVRDCLLLEDRGYEHRQFFREVQDAGGFFIVRGNKAIRPVVVTARDLRGRRIRALEGRKLSWEVLPPRRVDMEIEWGTGNERYRGRLVALYKRGQRNEKTFVYLHTNLDRAEFSATEVGNLYRLRWQIELLFKECKSHANLHRFDTEISAIAEGLIWASLLAVVLKRSVTHAAQMAIGVELSTQRAASCAKHSRRDSALPTPRRVGSRERDLKRLRFSRRELTTCASYS